MSMSPEHRAKLLASTKEQAAALLDDLQYLRDVIQQKGHSPSELRRASGVLRRLLVERDIAIIATPRLGRLALTAPDNRHYYDASDEGPFTFFCSGGMEIFNVKIGNLLVDTMGVSRHHLAMIPIGRTVRLRLDNFLSQRVLCLRGHWVSRADVIKYVANVASGVHSGTPATPTDETISKIRRAVKVTKTAENLPTFEFNMDALDHRIEQPFRYSPEAIDPALLELLSAASYLLKSEDTAKLETAIAEELR